jgi:branched-chain amino acid transport system ATP-binding protein
VPPAIELAGLRAGYGRIEVLHGVDLVVPTGSVFALLGPNGAGKTTTLSCIGGRVKPTTGCVHVGGVHVNGTAPDAMARVGVCSIPEGRAIFPNLTVAENLLMFGLKRWRPRAGLDEEAYGYFPVLGERRRQLAGTLSGGEQQMLAIARALITRPTVLLIDEISMGLAPKAVHLLYDAIVRLSQSGLTILLVEQFAATALAVADYAAVMTRGAIQETGEPADVSDALSAAYLGGAA